MKKAFLPIIISTLLLTSFNAPLSDKLVSQDLGIFKDYTKEEVINYYKDVKENSSKEELLLSLEKTLKNGQKEVSTKDGGTTWKYYLLVDRDYTKDSLSEEEIKSQKWKENNVICAPLYDETFTFIKSEKPGNKVNREHVFPKSYGFGNTTKDSIFLPLAATDMHNLHMGEAKNNKQGHNNYPYGNVFAKNEATAIKSSISGNITGYLGENKAGIPVYEPLDKDKGDIARSIFYMVARYYTYDETLKNSPSLRLSDTPTDLYKTKKTLEAKDTKNNPVQYGILTDLLSWNELDPVSDAEIHRNNLVYTNLQNNRNPFIDYPSWARICFDSSNNETNKKDNPSIIGNTSKPSEELKPNPPKNDNNKVEWYEELLNPKYFKYYIIIGLVLLALLISYIFKKINDKKKPSKSKKTNKSRNKRK